MADSVGKQLKEEKKDPLSEDNFEVINNSELIPTAVFTNPKSLDDSGDYSHFFDKEEVGIFIGDAIGNLNPLNKKMGETVGNYFKGMVGSIDNVRHFAGDLVFSSFKKLKNICGGKS